MVAPLFAPSPIPRFNGFALSPNPMSQPIQLLTFRTQGRWYACDLLWVREILRQPSLTPVDQAPPIVRGLIHLRGQILTALDLDLRLGCTGAGKKSPPPVVLFLKPVLSSAVSPSSPRPPNKPVWTCWACWSTRLATFFGTTTACCRRPGKPLGAGPRLHCRGHPASRRFGHLVARSRRTPSLNRHLGITPQKRHGCLIF